MLAQEIIRRKRDGYALDREQIDAFVAGLVDGSWSDSQAAAMAMAVYVNGMSRQETVELTTAMRNSGEVLDFSFPGPIVDKHSTGGVGDKVSLALAPIVAACGGYVPMISGRGLGHTGGTLDKLESIPGYRTLVPRAEIETALRKAGCAIVGASGQIAPADRRLYAVRDVTGTVESIPLICASILSKKLAAGLDAMVLDVKVGNGAFASDLAFARNLAAAITEVAGGCGLRTCAWITDMNQVLGRTCGNAVEVMEAVEFLRGDAAEPRFERVTIALCAELLVLGRIDATREAAEAHIRRVIENGKAVEHFARMVHALGGAADFVEHAAERLPRAPVQREVVADRDGWISGVATRDLGVACIVLGGGRRKSEDAIDPRVGFTHVASVGDRVQRGSVLAVVHAAQEADADTAARAVTAAFTIADSAPQLPPLLVSRVGPEVIRHERRSSSA
jgi:thymidine phosphorylase